MADALLEYWEEKLRIPLDLLVKEHFDKQAFSVMAHLDLPTSEDKIVKTQLKVARTESSGDHYSIVWGSLSVILNLFTSITRLVTEFGLLVKVVSDQPDGITFTIAHICQELTRILLVPDWAFSSAYGLTSSTPQLLNLF